MTATVILIMPAAAQGVRAHAALAVAAEGWGKFKLRHRKIADYNSPRFERVINGDASINLLINQVQSTVLPATWREGWYTQRESGDGG